MRLRSRIERLEKKLRALTAARPCGLCGGDGKFAVLIGHDTPEPPGCERCGKVRVIRIVAVDVDVERDGECRGGEVMRG